MSNKEAALLSRNPHQVMQMLLIQQVNHALPGQLMKLLLSLLMGLF
jgi:hypothetical protein